MWLDCSNYVRGLLGHTASLGYRLRSSLKILSGVQFDCLKEDISMKFSVAVRFLEELDIY
jgi:hypothetical protein